MTKAHRDDLDEAYRQNRREFAEGDKLPVTAQTERGSMLSRHDPTHVRGMEIARQAFRDHADTFEALAK